MVRVDAQGAPSAAATAGAPDSCSGRPWPLPAMLLAKHQISSTLPSAHQLDLKPASTLALRQVGGSDAKGVGAAAGCWRRHIAVVVDYSAIGASAGIVADKQIGVAVHRRAARAGKRHGQLRVVAGKRQAAGLIRQVWLCRQEGRVSGEVAAACHEPRPAAYGRKARGWQAAEHMWALHSLTVTAVFKVVSPLPTVFSVSICIS